MAGNRAEVDSRTDGSAGGIASRVLAELFGVREGGRPGASPLMEITPTASICATVEARLDLIDNGSPRALAPGPIVDRALGRLVELTTSDFGRHHQGSAAQRERLHWDVVQLLCQRIDHGSDIGGRAGTLRRGASVAEGAMERHYAEALLAGDRAAGPLAALGGLSGLRLSMALCGFPYAENYEVLTRSELAGVDKLAKPKTIVFCGGGPLPLSAVFLQLLSGARVTVVEVEPEAAALATAVVAQLEAIGVVGAGTIDVVLDDAANVDFSRFDLVMLASLLTPATVGAVRAAIGLLSVDRAPLLLSRSSAGLVARLAYAPAPHDDRPSELRHLGTVAPAGSVCHVVGVDESLAIPATSKKLLAVAPRSVLNLSELFVRR